MAAEIDIALTVEDLHKFYTTYFRYYTTINTPYQQLFITRCLRFITEKTIIGAEGFEPDNRVKAIIAACAVQLTLGLETWKFSYFETIIIHPGDFDDKASGLKFRGETNLAGFIRLSWKGFIAGYKVNNDNINLGLHEFMHAIRFSSIKGEIQDYFVEHYFNKWQAAAMEAFEDIKNNRETIFRKYGGTNINEFISVCIEHYFESPDEIKKHYPYLYYCTAILLNQQTQNNITTINIREAALTENNKLLNGFSEKTIKTSFLHSTSFIVMAIVLAPLIYTIYKTGIFSGASIFLEGMLIAIYLRFDFYFTKIHFGKTGFELNKGFIIFKNWRKISAFNANLISLRVYAKSKKDNDWEVLFYNGKNASFYEETISPYEIIDPDFVNELNNNRIAYFRS